MQKILVVDFGSQYTQLIARRLRELKIYSEVCPWDEITDIENVEGFILSGGPESSNIEGNPNIDSKIFDSGKPILGVCYGMQVLAFQEGGQIVNEGKKEFGHTQIKMESKSSIFAKTDNDFSVWMSHGDKVESLPEGYEVIASSDNSPIAAFQNQLKSYYGLQFHPEVTHTQHGTQVIKNFLKICNVKPNWDAADILHQIDNDVKESVGNDRVLLALSGGVDSTVLAAVLYKIIGKNLTCVMVDHGLLRKDEAKNVIANLYEKIGLEVNLVNAQELFLGKLAGVTDPETKRKIIGNTFIEVFEEESKKLDGIAWLAQGTIYPDVIESSGIKNGKAHVIKSHHNVGGLPSYLKLPLVEPLTSLFKDEVRKIGKELGLPDYLIKRHPFPGPGLAVRTLGDITKEKLEILKEADHIYMEELVKHKLYDKVSQAFAVFLPIKSVGVVGDARRYEYVIALRAAETIDFMTARAAKLNHDFLNLVSDRIINEISKVSRVVYDISSKPPATIEWE